MSATLQTKSKIPGFISLLLVIALGISLAKFMWLVITPAPTITFDNKGDSVAVVNQKKAVNYGKLIADQHIFGEVVVKKAPKVKKAEAVKAAPVKPRVKLNAKLQGIVAYKSKQGGYALISINNGTQKVYGKGETLQEGVTISDVLPSKVILDNRGNKEELLLPLKEARNGGGNSNTSPLNRRGYPTGQPKSADPAGIGLTGQKPNIGLDLNQFRQEALVNPSKLLEIIRTSNAIVNGQFVGFRIQPGSNRKMFRQLNFRPNDIITEVNGISLDDPNKGVQVLSELSQASSLSIKVKRGNQEVFIEHSL